MKLLSIVIPVYNPPLSLLNKCIESIKDNSWTNFECIFVYDYYSEEIKNKLIETCGDTRFKLIQNKNREGTHNNRTIGIENSNGDYYTFPDSDDFVDKDFYKSLIEQMESRGASSILSIARCINYQTGAVREKDLKIVTTEVDKDNLLEIENYDWLKGILKGEVVKNSLEEFKRYNGYLINIEDKIEHIIFCRNSPKIICSNDQKNLYNYIEFNVDSQCNFFTKSDLNAKLRFVQDLYIYSIHNSLNLDHNLDDIQYLIPFIRSNPNIVDKKELMDFISFYDKEKIASPKFLTTIPRIIHYVWLGGDMPEAHKQLVETWKKNKNFLILKWDDSFFKNNDFVQSCIKDKKYAFAADYIRCWVLYTFGGIYLDTDVECIKPFTDEMLDSEQLFGKEDDIIIQSAVLGSCYHNKYIKLLLDWFNTIKDVSDLEKIKPIYTINNIFTKIMKDSNVKIYPNEYFCANYYTEQGKKVYKSTDNTYCIHHFNGSWLKKEYKLEDFGFK
jgi:mannosyltransferase OCH1-like enzyme